jgi:hypothetical protein
MTGEMFGGQHRVDEASQRAEPAGWTKIRKLGGMNATALMQKCAQRNQNEIKTLLTRPTSLEMVISGFPNIYPGQTVPAHLQKRNFRLSHYEALGA